MKAGPKTPSKSVSSSSIPPEDSLMRTLAKSVSWFEISTDLSPVKAKALLFSDVERRGQKQVMAYAERQLTVRSNSESWRPLKMSESFWLEFERKVEKEIWQVQLHPAVDQPLRLRVRDLPFRKIGTRSRGRREVSRARCGTKNDLRMISLSSGCLKAEEELMFAVLLCSSGTNSIRDWKGP